MDVLAIGGYRLGRAHAVRELHTLDVWPVVGDHPPEGTIRQETDRLGPEPRCENAVKGARTPPALQMAEDGDPNLVLRAVRQVVAQPVSDSRVARS